MDRNTPKPLLTSTTPARSKPLPAGFSDPLAAPRADPAVARPARLFYAVERVYPRAVRVLVGQGGLHPDAVAEVLNRRAAEGWQLVTTTLTTARLWIFWKREAALLTFVRKV